MPDKIAKSMAKFREAVYRHDEINPTHNAYGIGLAHFDMERLGFDEGENLWGAITIHVDGGQSGNFRVLCDGEHTSDGEQVEDTVRKVAGIDIYA